MAEIKKTSARKSRRRSRHAEALESTQKAIPHALWAHKAKAANDPYTMRLDFPDELIIDNFAGGGGTSTGLEAAFGRPVDIAINHDPEALSMHALNHPHTKHLLQSVWDVKPKEVTGNQPVALVWLSPDCFPAGTLVLTRSGYQPIQTVTVGQEVLTHKGRWRCVTETSNARRPLMNIRGHGHPGLKVSPEHPFYVRNSAQSSPEWAPASALKKGLFWATPHAFPKSSVPPVSGRGMDLTPSLMWLAGQYAGNGWTRINEKKGELVLTCGEHKADELRKILISSWPRTSLRAGFNELTWQERKTRTAVQFSTSHRGLVEWLREHFGHLAPNKSVPAWCLGLSRDFRQALLTGYLAADGYKADDFFEVTSVSKALAFSVKALAASLGHTVAVYQRQNTNFIEGRKVNARPGWLLRWRHAVDEAHRQTFRKDHLEWTPIRECGTPEGEEQVFNIGVEEDESYVVEGIVVHNCKHFSKAKGGTPVAKHIRGLAWVGMRWVALTKPRVLMLENVEEFTSWGPLIIGTDGKARPDPARKGKTFESFVRQLRAHGYAVEWSEMRACANGAPTIRKRLFLVARRDGLPIVWPEATHGDPSSREVKSGDLLPYRTAAECIDFGLPAQSIFGRKKSLVANTCRRVAKGLFRHVLTSPKPFLVNTRNGERVGQAPRIRGVDEPYWTVTSLGSQGALAEPVVAPFAAAVAGPEFSDKKLAMDGSMDLSKTENHGGVVAGHITKFRTGSSGASMNDPMPTVTANSFIKRPGGSAPLGFVGASLEPLQGGLEKDEAGQGPATLVAAHLNHLTHHGERPGRTPDEPLPTITGAHRGEQAMVLAHLVDMGHGEGKCGTKRFSHGVRSVEAPLNTVTASGGTSALTACYFEQANGGFYQGEGRSADQPMSTITSSGSNQQLVTAYCVKYEASVSTVAARGKGSMQAEEGEPVETVRVMQVPMDGVDSIHVDRARQCAALLHEHLPDQFPEPAEMVMVWQHDQWWVLVDITLRMLKPRELYRAQGFPSDYLITEIPDPALLFKNGVQVSNPLDVPRIPLSGTAQVRMCGNSVSPLQAEALARANFAHEALIHGRVAA